MPIDDEVFSKLNLIKTNLEGHFAFQPPPASFDPLNASAEDLRFHGFPARPIETHAAGLALWKRVVGAIEKVVVPELVLLPDVVHGPRRGTDPAIVITPPASPTDPRWSGAISRGAGDYLSVFGEWTAPSVRRADGGKPQDLSIWVGLDGDLSPDVLQAGTSHDPATPDTPADHYAWYEWYPDGAIAIRHGFPVQPGDSMFVTVSYAGSYSKGHVSMVNLSSGVAFAMGIDARKGTVGSHSSAEWILERGTKGGVLSDLPRYGAVTFTNVGCTFGDPSGVGPVCKFAPETRSVQMVDGKTELSREDTQKVAYHLFDARPNLNIK